MRADLITVLEILAQQPNVNKKFKPFIHTFIIDINSHDFLKDITHAKLNNAHHFIKTLCSFLNKSKKSQELNIEKEGQLKAEEETIENTEQKSNEQLKILNKALKKLWSHKEEVLEKSSHSKPSGLGFNIASTEQNYSKKSEGQPVQPKTTLFSQIADFFTTIKNKISSFFESLFKRSDDQPWQWK